MIHTVSKLKCFSTVASINYYKLEPNLSVNRPISVSVKFPLLPDKASHTISLEENQGIPETIGEIQPNAVLLVLDVELFELSSIPSTLNLCPARGIFYIFVFFRSI